jgi:hypothetical protein
MSALFRTNAFSAFKAMRPTAEHPLKPPNVRMQRSGWDKVQIEATAAGR